MADILWPTTLPQAPGTFSQAKDANSTIRTSPDDGPAKMRRRFTKSVKKGNMSWILTLAQYAILETFYETTLNEGTQFFVMNHPWTNVATKFRFIKPLSYSAEGALAVQANAEWELF